MSERWLRLAAASASSAGISGNGPSDTRLTTRPWGIRLTGDWTTFGRSVRGCSLMRIAGGPPGVPGQPAAIARATRCSSAVCVDRAAGLRCGSSGAVGTIEDGLNITGATGVSAGSASASIPNGLLMLIRLPSDSVNSRAGWRCTVMRAMAAGMFSAICASISSDRRLMTGISRDPAPCPSTRKPGFVPDLLPSSSRKPGSIDAVAGAGVGITIAACGAMAAGVGVASAASGTVANSGGAACSTFVTRATDGCEASRNSRRMASRETLATLISCDPRFGRRVRVIR